MLSIIKGNVVSKQNLTLIVGVWWVIVLCMASIVGMAQDTMLETDTPVSVEIGDAPAWLTYDGLQGEVISITTLTAITDTAPDTIIEILYPNGKRLDYADDTILEDGNIKSDAAITNLELPIEGLYKIRIDSFNGVSEGTVEVLLTGVNNNLDVLATEELSIVRGDITELDDLRYDIELQAEQAISITARDISGTIDPMLFIYDTDDILLNFNDDHQSNDLSLNVLDAHIASFIPETDGTVTIVVRDYLGRAGRVEVVIQSLVNSN